MQTLASREHPGLRKLNKLNYLSNLGNINAALVNEKILQWERMLKLNAITKQQMKIVKTTKGQKLLKQGRSYSNNTHPCDLNSSILASSSSEVTSKYFARQSMQ
jgi:hypothetical protein